VPIQAAFGVLPAVNFDNQTPFATDEIGIITTDRLLPDKFETAELPIANMAP
jgi:hypothetical protein